MWSVRLWLSRLYHWIRITSVYLKRSVYSAVFCSLLNIPYASKLDVLYSPRGKQTLMVSNCSYFSNLGVLHGMFFWINTKSRRPHWFSCQGLANYGPLAKSGPMLIFVNKALLEHSHTFVFILSLAALFYHGRVE